MQWFIDFDEVLTDSIESVLITLNKKYSKDIKPNEVELWNFSDCFEYVTDQEVENIFDSQDFFNNLKWKPHMKKFLLNLCNNKNDIITIVTKGGKENLIKKYKWLQSQGFKDFLNFNFIGLSINQSKGEIDMSKGIFIDDNENNLTESNAMVKILYENYPNKEWNSSWKGIKIVPYKNK